jgi:hypothetical protein
MKTWMFFCSQEDGPNSLTRAKGKYNPLNSSDIHSIGWTGAWRNKEPLPFRYNQILESLSTYNPDRDTVVLCHDDLVITDVNWLSKLEHALEKYDVVGLAGGSEAAIQQPALWHIMCKRETLSGTVKHVNFADNSVFATHFGPTGRVLMLDGLFLAFNVKKIMESGARFDETNPCIAHFYDLDFSLTCNKHKLKLGTVNIEAIHSSPGLKSYTPDWLAGQEWFLKKWKK